MSFTSKSINYAWISQFFAKIYSQIFQKLKSLFLCCLRCKILIKINMKLIWIFLNTIRIFSCRTNSANCSNSHSTALWILLCPHFEFKFQIFPQTHPWIQKSSFDKLSLSITERTGTLLMIIMPKITYYKKNLINLIPNNEKNSNLSINSGTSCKDFLITMKIIHFVLNIMLDEILSHFCFLFFF